VDGERRVFLHRSQGVMVMTKLWKHLGKAGFSVFVLVLMIYWLRSRSLWIVSEFDIQCLFGNDEDRIIALRSLHTSLQLYVQRPHNSKASLSSKDPKLDRFHH
jgi:hypothetical protein